MNLNQLIISIAIALLWVIFYSINHILFRLTEVSAITSLIFIPSRFKVASASIYRMRAIPGLFLGALITGFLFLKEFSWLDIIVFSSLSASLPYVALKLVEWRFPLKNDLSNLSPKHVMYLSVIYAILNGLFHICYRYHALFLRDAHEIYELLSMVLGDILGIVLFMYLISKITRFLIAKRSSI